MWHRKTLRPMLLLTCMALFVGSASRADGPGDTTAQDKQLSDALRDMHNRAADLFNVNKDFPGAYRMFQGGLYMARPLLAHRPEVQQILDSGMLEADRLASMPERAMRLHKTIEDMRAKLKSAQSAKPPEAKPADPKPDPKPPVVPFPAPPPTATTLWKRLGSDDGVRKIVDDFMTLVMIDKNIDFTRGGKFITTKEQEALVKGHLVAFIGSMCDGTTLTYTGRKMAEAHRGMAITNEQFDEMARSLRLALRTNKINDADIEELMKKVVATKDEIVGK